MFGERIPLFKLNRHYRKTRFLINRLAFRLKLWHSIMMVCVCVLCPHPFFSLDWHHFLSLCSTKRVPVQRLDQGYHPHFPSTRLLWGLYFWRKKSWWLKLVHFMQENHPRVRLPGEKPCYTPERWNKTWAKWLATELKKAWKIFCKVILVCLSRRPDPTCRENRCETASPWSRKAVEVPGKVAKAVVDLLFFGQGFNLNMLQTAKWSFFAVC